MKLGGIIAGALGGGAQAFGQIADNAIRTQAEDQRFARERAVRQEDAATQRQWRKEDAIWEMDQRLQRIGGEVQAKTQAGINSQRMLNDERNRIKTGLIDGEMSKMFDIRNPEAMTPGERTAIDQAKAAERARLENDPNIGREVGLQMGEINQAQIMGNDVARERAENQKLRDQMRADLEEQKEEGRNERADKRAEAMLAAAGIRADGKGKVDQAEKLNTTISTNRQFIASAQERLQELGRRKADSPEAVALREDIEVAQKTIRAAMRIQQSRLDGAGEDSVSPQKSGPGDSQARPRGAASSAPSEIENESIRIKRMEYDKAVGQGDQELAAALARELKNRHGVDVKASVSAQPSGGKVPFKSSGVQAISSQEEYAKLPSGTRFRAPDGSIRIKP